MFQPKRWLNLLIVLALLLGSVPDLTGLGKPASPVAAAQETAAQPATDAPVRAARPLRNNFQNNVPDNRGREFWLTFPMNHDGVGNTLQFFITSHVNTTGAVSIPGLSFSQAFNVTAGQITTINLPAGAEITSSDETLNNGIHVTATEEVTVYGLTFDEEAGVGVTADAYLALPTDVLATDYLVLGYETDSNVDVPGSQFALVGVQNDTTVVITPTADTWNGSIGRLTGEAYQITLDQGQTYLLYADGFDHDDLTGTPIHADKPVAVFGGNRCANIPYGYEACDTVVEQLPPVRTWGKEFVVVPLASRSNGDTFRVLASQDDTSVWIDGTEVPAALARGAFYETVLTTRAHITATHPVLVAQYSNGQTYDSTLSDPFMMLIPPYEQFQGAYVINTPASGFPRNYLNVVAPTHVITDVFMDGAPITATLFQTIGSSGFSGAQVAVTLGAHQLTGTLPFGVFSYGFVDYGSYGYPGGGALGPIGDVATLTLTLPPGDVLYVGTHYCISATVSDAGGNPVAGVRVDFDVTGEHPQQSFGVSNAQGQVPICYTGTQVGFDTIVAAMGTLFDTAIVEWVEAGQTYTLTIAKTGTGDGVVTPTVGVHTYPSATVVALGATPYPTSTFEGWSGDADCTDASVTMTASKACTATFTLSAATPAITISKTAQEMTELPLIVGDRILYTIRVTNTGAVSLTSLRITDTLPAGVTYFGIPKGSPLPIQTGPVVVWAPAAALAPGAALTFKVIVKVDGTADPIGCNNAMADSAETATAAAGPICLGDGDVDTGLELLKTATDVNGLPLYVNDLVRYDIAITNTHPVSTMTGLVITETVPAGLVFESATPPGNGTNPLTWTHASLAPGGVWTATVLLRVDGSANPVGSNVVTVTSRQQDETATDPVPPPGPVVVPGLDISKTAQEMTELPLLVGDRILYTIRVTNTSAVSLTSLRITDTLPAGVTYFGIPKGSPIPIQTGAVVVWAPAAALAPGAALTFKVIVKVDGTADPIGCNNATADSAETATAAAGPICLGDGDVDTGLELLKTATDVNGLPLYVNDLVRYDIRITNTHPVSAMTGLVITETVPAGLVFESATPPGNGTNPLTWTQASLAPGGVWTATVLLRVDGSANPIGSNVVTVTSRQQDETATDPVPPPGPVVVPGLDISKTAQEMTAPPLLVGDRILYTIRVTNTSAVPLTSLRITDTLPAGVTYFGIPKGSPLPIQTGPVVVWAPAAALAPGAALTFKVIVKVDGTADPIGCNNATADSAETATAAAGPICLGDGDVDTGLELLKTATDVNGLPLYVNDLVRYDIRITNTHPVSAMTGLVITETVPAGLVFESATPPGNGTNPVTWTHASLAPGGVWTATVLLRVDGSANPVGSNVVTVTSRQQDETATDPVPPPGPVVVPGLDISKTAQEMTAPPLLVGDRILYTIRVTNTSAVSLTSLRITDTLPAGVTYFGIPKGSPLPIQTGPVVVWTHASLAPGAWREYKVIGKATGDVSPIGDNLAAATCAEDSAPVTATANLADPTVQEALELLKDAVDLNGAPLLVDDVIRYPIYVTNTHASVTMTGVVVTDTLPAGTVFVTATQPYTLANGVLWWQVGDLAPGASWTVAVDQRVTSAVNPIAGNIAAVWSDQQDWQDTGEITPPDPVIQTGLKLHKTAEEYQNAPPLLVNDRILYTIRVTNTTTGTLTNLRITDTLPAGVSYFGIPKGSPTPLQTGPAVVWTLPSLAAGASQTFKVIVKVNGTANPIGVNLAQATCAEEAVPAAALAQVPGDGVHEPGLVISGTATGGGTPPNRLATQAIRAPGDLITYAITLTNANPTHTMSAVSVTAALPSGVEFVSAAPPGHTGVATLTWEIGSLAPGAVWEGEIVVRITGAVGDMHLAAASAEQSPVEAVVAAPPGVEWRLYVPLVMRMSAP